MVILPRGGANSSAQGIAFVVTHGFCAKWIIYVQYIIIRV